MKPDSVDSGASAGERDFFSEPAFTGVQRGGSWRDKRDPCAVCGWAKHMAIHLPVVSGPRKGLPWGHAYVAQQQES
jgi:hypothetical protein